MKYAIFYRPSALRDLDWLPDSVRSRLRAAIAALAENPRRPGTRVLTGTLRGMMRLRVGDYRVSYVIDDAAREIDIVRAGHRGGFYDR
jgi:mRNA interferase RelE/StbE